MHVNGENKEILSMAGALCDLQVLLFAGCIKRVLSYAFGYKSTNTTRRIPIHNAVRGDTIDDARG